MKRLVLAVLAVLAAALLYAAPASPAPSDPVRIMPLGDSITGSPGCWRALLWNRLQSTGYTGADFVGTLPPQGCGVAYDGDNEGHGGYLATNIASQNMLPGWLAATHPDVVLMHLGTNDVWSNIAPATILSAFTTLVNQMRASNPAMRILVAQIIPMNPSSCAECGARTVAFNAAIPAWAAGLSTARSPVVVVDQWSGFNTATDTNDGVHPNAAGDQKMSDRWYPPLKTVLDGGLPSASPTAASPTASRTSSPSASPSRTGSPSVSPTGSAAPGGCAAQFTVIGQWPGGYQGEVAVRNPGTTALRGWTVTFRLPAGVTVTQAWNARVSQAGQEVTASNVDWNGAVGAGASTTFGMLGNGSPGTAPAVTCRAV
jgi:lysophospholipase L1-like esterase